MPGERGRDTVVVAASAGGIEALRGLLSRLPSDLPAAVLVVLHVPAAGSTVLPKILARAGPLPAAVAADGQEPVPGHVYVASPDHHLLLMDHELRLSQGPRHNGHRPAADPLFISAALSAGPRAIGVVLSGALDDGAAGCAAIERRGGVVLIEDPRECAYDGMPLAAAAATSHPRVLGLERLAITLDRETRVMPPSGPPPDPTLERQLRVFTGPAPEPAAASHMERGDLPGVRRAAVAGPRPSADDEPGNTGESATAGLTPRARKRAVKPRRE